jgi:5-methylcytosine-specific restriction endonuclease McrA
VEIASRSIVALQKLRCYNGIMNTRCCERLTDEQLLADLDAAAAKERVAIAELIALLAEMDSRKLYLAEGYSSLFVYCTKSLKLSEHAAYGRIEAARASRRFPLILRLLTDGSITLTTVCLLAAHLTDDNHRDVLGAAIHKTKREVEQQVAGLAPRPPVPSVIRRLPASNTAAIMVERPSDRSDASLPRAPLSIGTGPAAVQRRHNLPVVRPLAPERYKMQITITQDTHDKLRRAQDLLRHVLPNGDPAAIFDRALTRLLHELERKKLAHVDRPRREAPSTNVRGRHVPAAVRRAVWARDAGQCAFVGTGDRCTERGFLEIHHVLPFADGGPTTLDNLQLRCRAHNAYEAKAYFDSFVLRDASLDW